MRIEISSSVRPSAVLYIGLEVTTSGTVEKHRVLALSAVLSLLKVYEVNIVYSADKAFLQGNTIAYLTTESTWGDFRGGAATLTVDTLMDHLASYIGVGLMPVTVLDNIRDGQYSVTHILYNKLCSYIMDSRSVVNDDTVFSIDELTSSMLDTLSSAIYLTTTQVEEAETREFVKVLNKCEFIKGYTVKIHYGIDHKYMPLIAGIYRKHNKKLTNITFSLENEPSYTIKEFGPYSLSGVIVDDKPSCEEYYSLNDMR